MRKGGFFFSRRKSPIITPDNKFFFWSLSAAGLMHTFNAHAATDITGFGILGHAQNLAKQQRNEVSFVIHNLPVLAKMAAVSKACGNMFGLMHGTCPETSGIRILGPNPRIKLIRLMESSMRRKKPNT